MIFSLVLITAFALSGYSQNVRVEQEQTFIYEGDTLHGTLLSSGKTAKKFNKLPLVIFISGSGPTDRNGNSIMIPGPNDSFKQLADSLLKYGVASFRYDKLGVAASKMSKTEDELRFEDNSEVVKAAIAKMKDLRFKEIYLLGHSEGSLVAILAAQQAKIKGLISVAGPAENAFETIQKQLKQSLPEEMASSTIRKLDSVKMGHTVTKYDPSLAALLRPSVQPYLTSYFKYTPTEEIQKLEIPVMIIQGGYDLQVTEADSEALKKAYPTAQYKFYPSMNHVLKQVDDSREQNIASYGDPDFPLAPDLASDIAGFINNN